MEPLPRPSSHERAPCVGMAMAAQSHGHGSALMGPNGPIGESGASLRNGSKNMVPFDRNYCASFENWSVSSIVAANRLLHRRVTTSHACNVDRFFLQESCRGP